MIGNRGVLVTFLAITFMVMILMGLGQKPTLNRELCSLYHIDNCARSGGLSR